MQNPQDVQFLIEEFGPTAHARFSNLAQPFRTVPRRVDRRAGAGNGPAAIQRFESIQLMRDINPHLEFSVSFLTSLKKHPLYARSRKQWRLARGQEETNGVKK